MTLCQLYANTNAMSTGPRAPMQISTFGDAPVYTGLHTMEIFLFMDNRRSSRATYFRTGHISLP